MRSWLPVGVGDLQVHRSTLAFSDHELERAYWTAFAGDFLPYLRRGHLALLFLLVAFAPVDHYVFPHLAAPTWAWRYGIVLPTMTALGITLWHARWLELFHRHPQEVLVGAAAGTLAGLLAGGFVMMSDADATVAYVGTMGMLFAVEFLSGFARLRFIYTAPVSLAAAGSAFLIGVLQLQAAPLVLAVIGFFATVGVVAGMLAAYVLELNSRIDFARDRELQAERAISEDLLHNILPAEVAERLKERPEPGAEAFPEVSVLFADIVDFTPLAERLSPDQVVETLDRIFTRFDELTERHGAEKIKTIGDAYMVAAGVPSPSPRHAERLAALALDLRDAVRAFGNGDLPGLGVRIGIHCGPVLAGIIGRHKFCYDLWGDTVNTAARLESHGLADRIQISGAMRNRLGEHFETDRRGVIDIKGKGPTETWWLMGPLGGT